MTPAANTSSFLQLIRRNCINNVRELLIDVDNLNHQYQRKTSQYHQYVKDAENESLHQYIRHSLIIEGVNDKDLPSNELKLKKVSLILEDIRPEKLKLGDILKAHSMIIENGGQIRSHFIGIRHPRTGLLVEKMMSPVGLQDRMEAFAKSVNDPGNLSIPPIIEAVDLKRQLVAIHPFGDGNGSLSRSLFNWYIRKNGYKVWTTFPSNEIIEYCEAIASTNYEIFYRYALNCIIRSLERQLKDIEYLTTN